MKPQRILLPIDTAKCPLEVFAVVNGFAWRPEVTVILLHVVNLNIVAPENRVYEELGREVYSHLSRLAHEYIHPFASTSVRVRAGQPEEEILAEAAEQKADLIILPSWGPSWWGRLTSAWKRQPGATVSRWVQRIVRKAACAVSIVNVKSRFNCQKAWGRRGREIEDTLRYLRIPPAARAAPSRVMEDASAMTNHPSRLAA
jgi:nucleotide-binding universal stress UspA family protein